MTKRILFFCAALALVLGAGTLRAQADGPSRLSSLTVKVWPEYDTPTVLVILDGQFADTSASARQVSVSIPSSARLHVATYANSDGTLAKEVSTQSSNLGDGFSQVTFSVPASNFWLEYYDDALKGTTDKSLDFSLRAPAAADQLTLEVQQPLKATNFSITPSTPNTRTEDGFTNYISTLTNVTSGQLVSAQVKYTKTDPNPSVQPDVTSAAAPASLPATAPAPSTWNNVFVIVGIVVLGLTAFLGFFMLQRQRTQQWATAPVSNRNSRRAGRPSKASSVGGVFCTQCGRSLGHDDNFCPKCGAKRRVA